MPACLICRGCEIIYSCRRSWLKLTPEHYLPHFTILHKPLKLSKAMSNDEIKANGWTAVPVSGKLIFQSQKEIGTPAPVTVKDIYFPSEVALVADAQAFAKKRLSPEAFNHSMRVYYWGMTSKLIISIGAHNHLHRTCHWKATPARARSRPVSHNLGAYLSPSRHRHSRGILHHYSHVL